MDDQRSNREGGGSVNRFRFSMRLLMLVVVLFAVGFTTINLRLARRNLDVSARRTSLEGQLAWTEKLKQSYDEHQMNSGHWAYKGAEKHITELKQQLKELDD